MHVRSRIAVKMLMNAHSTAVMTKLGRVVGNTMTNVRAANLKLIGRATYLVKMHVDDFIRRALLQASMEISYAEANAVLFQTIDYLQESGHGRDQESPVPITIIRVCESLRGKALMQIEEADILHKERGLENYLNSYLL